MSHFSEYKGGAAAPDGRNLGDEWVDWDGRDGGTIREGRGAFLVVSGIVIALMDLIFCLFVYMMSPRLLGWKWWLPDAAWFFAWAFIIATGVIFFLVAVTVLTEKKFILFDRAAYFLFDLVFSRAFRLAGYFGISRDRIGHSFVRVSNSLSHALKPAGRDERLLILLPRCLSKEELKNVNDLKAVYPLEVYTVSGGELARKKVKEMKPTAVIGVACERDLVSGIRDVGRRISVTGIPNQRPEGPCKNTHINMNELVRAIEFYVGRPAQTAEGTAKTGDCV